MPKKNSRISIGTIEGGPDLAVDVQALVETRLAIQASSGGGKSMTLRTLLERTYGMLPHIVLDKDGDVPADPRTAAMLAQKVLELNASLIVDLYDLPHADKHRFVRLFLESYLNAPKSLWRPRLLVIDEAHRFCPENGEGTSEAKEAVIECCDNGRKRGIGVVLATQRIAKLDKSALSECGNKLVGMTNMDDDRRRAARELGFSGQADVLSMRDLDRGEFYAVGPAVSFRKVVKARIHVAKTTHPKAGHRARHRPAAPTAVVKAMLAKLKDLPKEAEADIRDRQSMMARIRDLEARLRASETASDRPKAEPPSKDALDRAAATGEARAIAAFGKASAKSIQEFEGSIMTTLLSGIRRLKSDVEANIALGSTILLPTKATAIPPMNIPAAQPPKITPRMLSEKVAAREDAGKLGQCERRILGFLASKPGQSFSRRQVGVMSGYAHEGGAFASAVARLNVAGLISKHGDGMIRLAGPLPSEILAAVQGDIHTLQDWIEGLGRCERAIYELLLAYPHTPMSREAIGEATRYNPAGGGFASAVARLNTLGLIQKDPGGTLRINPEVVGL